VVNAALANDGYPTWWVSADDGAHWGRGMNFDASGAKTGDADAAFGADGYLYVMNLAFNDPPQEPVNPTVLVYGSADGSHFAGPAGFPLPHGADQPDRPWLFTDPHHPERVYVSNSEGAGDVVLWTSDDHAGTFSGPTLVTGAASATSIELTSRPFFDPTDPERIFMLYEAGDLTDLIPPDPGEPLRDFPLARLMLAESPDAGLTWTQRVALDITDAFGPAAAGGSLGHVIPAPAIDEKGTLYAAFSLRPGGSTETHIYLIHSRDHGTSWSAPVQVDSGDLRSNVMPAIAAGAPGRLDVSWYGSRSADFADSASEWAEMFAQSLDALSARPTFAAAPVGGVTHVGTVDSSGNPGHFVYDWGLRDFQSIAVDAAGMAHLAWTDTRRGVAMTARQVAGPSVLAAAKPSAVPPGQPKPKTPRAGSSLPGTGVGVPRAPLLLIALTGALAFWARRRAA
jgi:hypothetical protein